MPSNAADRSLIDAAVARADRARREEARLGRIEIAEADREKKAERHFKRDIVRAE